MKRWQSFLAGAVLLPLAAAGQQFNLSSAYAGGACALQLTRPGMETVTLAATGPTPATGGEHHGFLPGSNPAPGVLVQTLSAATVAGGGRNDAQATVAYLVAALGRHYVAAYWLQAHATATAGFLNVSTSGKSSAAGELVVDGRNVPVTGAPNQTITFPDGRLIINEQIGSSSAKKGSPTVNALHLIVNGAGSLIAASATAEVVNPPTPRAGF